MIYSDISPLFLFQSSGTQSDDSSGWPQSSSSNDQGRPLRRSSAIDKGIRRFVMLFVGTENTCVIIYVDIYNYIYIYILHVYVHMLWKIFMMLGLSTDALYILMNTPYKQKLLHKHHADSTLPGMGAPKKASKVISLQYKKITGCFFTMALDSGRNLYIP